MKKLFYILIFLSFLSCKNSKETDFAVVENVQQDSIIESEPLPEYKEPIITEYDEPKTLVKKSKPFVINGIKCYWELTGSVYDDFYLVFGTLELKNNTNNKVLLSNEDMYYRSYFEDEDLSLESQDANFDGFQDFVFSSRTGSGSGGSGYRIYFFDNNKKSFDSLMEIGNLEINPANKTISGSWKMGAGWNSNEVHYFGKNGKIKYSENTIREVISGDTATLLKTTYEKIINKKVVETQIDTTKFEGW